MMMMKKRKLIGSSSSCSTTTNGEEEGEEEEEEEEEEELLPQDLISEIFTHLPPISLLRFKSVSKTLQSLISNPNFIRRNTVPPPGILLKLGQDFSDDSKILMVSPSPLDGEYGYSYYSKLLQNLIDYRPEHDQPPDGNYEKVKLKLIDSCNGLLLYSNCIKHKNPPVGKCILYVCNPITKDYIKLPTFEQEHGFNKLYHSLANLVFDPSLSLTYKVVIWLYDYVTWRLYVYSSNTRSWRLSVSINDNDFVVFVLKKQFYYGYYDFRAVLLNGVLYWSKLVAPTIDVLICYDVEKDSVWTLKFPKMPLEYVSRELFYFGVCGGCLRLIEKYSKPMNEWEFAFSYWQRTFPSSFDVMEMNQLQLQQQHLDYQDGNIDRDLWTVKYRVNIGKNGYPANLIGEESLFTAFILDLYKTTTKAGGEGEELLLCINVHNNRLVVSFNLSDNTFGKGLRNNELWEIDRFSGFTDVLRYTFSLFPVHSLTRLEYCV